MKVFGPYIHSGLIKEVLRVLRKMFPFKDDKSHDRRHEEFYRAIGRSPRSVSQNDQVTMANDHLEKANKLIPEIEGLFSMFADKPKVSYFEGQENVMQIYADHLNVKKPYEMVAWANTTYLKDLLKSDFFLHYRKTKEKLGITTRGIVPDTDYDVDFVKNTYTKIGIAEKYWPWMKYISHKDFSFEGEITIYSDDKVSIVNLHKNHYPGTVIQDKTIHNMMRMIFELSWKGADTYEK